MQLAAIVTRSNEKKQKANEDHPAAEILGSFEELIAKASLYDLAVITTPNTEHASQAIAAMKAGLNVVVDKPIATNSQDCEAMIKCSHETGTVFSVFQNRRWDADFLTIKQLIQSQTLGQITRFESRWERFRPEPKTNAWRETSSSEEGGGILFDLGSHAIDQITHLFGKPEHIYAEMNIRRKGVKSDDDSFVAMTFKDGLRAHLWVNLLAPAPAPRFRVVGSQGTYEKLGVDPQEEALRSGKTPLDPNWGKEDRQLWGKLTQYKNGMHFEGSVESIPGCHEKFYELMRDAILGKGEVPVRPEDALLTLQIIEAARQSNSRQLPLAMSHS